MTGRRIGLLGGTFDPVHAGHLVAGVNVLHDLGLDEVLFVVANEPWQKLGTRPVSRAADRLALVEAAVRNVEGLSASAIEIERGGMSYTADTVAELSSAEPDAAIFVIVGADVASALTTWVRLDEVLAQAEIVVVNRPGVVYSPPDPDGPLRGLLVSGSLHTIEVPALEISSTDLRDRAATGRPLDFLVPHGAIREIERRNLYRVDR